MEQLSMMPQIDQQTEPGIAGSGVVSLTRFATRCREGRVKEVMTTSDFGFMAAVIDRGVAIGYMSDAIQPYYQTVGHLRNTRDFSQATDYRLNAPRLIPRVAEKGEYKPIDPEDEYFNLRTYKYGAQYDLSWEAWLRDDRDLGLIRQHPESWGLSAQYTRQYLFTQAYAASATIYTGAQGNLGTGVLNADNYDIAKAALANMTDPSGNTLPPITTWYLVVPPNLEGTARQLLESQLLITGTGGTQGNVNVWQGTATLIVDPFLPVLDAVNGATSWYLFADPRIRPALRYGFVTGYEGVEIFIKDSDAKAFIGGSDDPFSGSYLTDDISFKVRFTFGVDALDYRGTYRSDGTV